VRKYTSAGDAPDEDRQQNEIEALGWRAIEYKRNGNGSLDPLFTHADHPSLVPMRLEDVIDFLTADD
jgi:hypothetical protein